MDLAEFSQVGADLIDLGGKLKAKKAQREELNAEISDLEEKIRPLIVRHSQLLAEVIGSPPPIVIAPTNGAGNNNPPPPPPDPQTNHDALRKRVLQYLQHCEPGVSAGDVAEHLHLDPSLVRDVMRELMVGRGR